MIRKALVELTGGLCGAHCTAGHGDGRSRLEIFDFVREMCWKMLENYKASPHIPEMDGFSRFIENHLLRLPQCKSVGYT